MQNLFICHFESRKKTLIERFNTRGTERDILTRFLLSKFEQYYETFYSIVFALFYYSEFEL